MERGRFPCCPNPKLLLATQLNPVQKGNISLMCWIYTPSNILPITMKYHCHGITINCDQAPCKFSLYLPLVNFTNFLFSIQRIMNEEFQHIQKVHCSLHVFNLETKTLLKYFMTTIFWKEHLSLWQKANSDPLIDTPSLIEGFIKSIEASSQQNFQAGTKISQFNVYSSSRFEPFKKHCLNFLHSQTKAFHKEICMIEYWLNDFSTSQRLEDDRFAGCFSTRVNQLLLKLHISIQLKESKKLSLTTLKMITQIKLHLLQGDPLLVPCKSHKSKEPTRDDLDLKPLETWFILNNSPLHPCQSLTRRSLKSRTTSPLGTPSRTQPSFWSLERISTYCITSNKTPSFPSYQFCISIIAYCLDPIKINHIISTTPGWNCRYILKVLTLW
ncbi:hypothetical protein VP01_734g1 [Puccinia sorghi]|uniref:Uncharacterized protein n=1 Tax=Puccinia sorghi TaxID=27349 RepID=A0A0L6UF02_9BASI|nr:hypothetical protein VP01_734g1 [Puccinia sorghi]